MHRIAPQRSRLLRATIRPLAALLIALGFIFIARQIEPAGSLAGNGAALGDPVSGKPSTTNESARRNAKRLLGTIRSADYTIEIFASPDGPRYTVTDEFGETLATELPENELYRVLPDLDFGQLIADGPNPGAIDDLPER